MTTTPFFRCVTTRKILTERRIVPAHTLLEATKPTHSGLLPENKNKLQHLFYFNVYILYFVCYCQCVISIFTKFLVNFIHTSAVIS